MNLRNYKEDDAKEILNWIKNEKEFRLWSADIYKGYPATPSDINNNYEECKKNPCNHSFVCHDCNIGV